MTKRALALALTLLIGADAYLACALCLPSELKVETLPAGKGGQASLIRMPDGRAILVGASSDASILRGLGSALPPWTRHLDALVLLDERAEDAGGAPFVLARYRVGALVVRQAGGTPARDAALAGAASAAGVRIQRVPPAAGLVLRAGAGVRLNLPPAGREFR